MAESNLFQVPEKCQSIIRLTIKRDKLYREQDTNLNVSLAKAGEMFETIFRENSLKCINLPRHTWVLHCITTFRISKLIKIFAFEIIH